MLSTPKSSGYSPGNHLSAKLPWGGRGTPPELLHHHPNTLTFPSLIFGVFGHFPSLVTLWSWSLQGETQDQDPKIKSQFFKILGELAEHLFLDTQEFLCSFCIWGDNALNSVVPRAMFLSSTVGSLRIRTPLLSRGPAQGVTQPSLH